MVTLRHSRNGAIRLLAGLAAVGVAVTLGLALSSESAGTLSAPGGPIQSMPVRIDTPLLFPSPSGQLWHESNFRRDVWARSRRHLGLERAEHETAGRLPNAATDRDQSFLASHSPA